MQAMNLLHHNPHDGFGDLFVLAFFQLEMRKLLFIVLLIRVWSMKHINQGAHKIPSDVFSFETGTMIKKSKNLDIQLESESTNQT